MLVPEARPLLRGQVRVVSLDGQTWTPKGGAWKPDATAVSTLTWR